MASELAQERDDSGWNLGIALEGVCLEGRANRIYYSCDVGSERRVKDDSKAFSPSKWKDGLAIY